jgi:hypothetical protein
MTVAYVAIFAYTLSLGLVGPDFDCRRSDQGRSGKYFFSFAVAFSVSGMHRRYYESWEHRDEFTARCRKELGGMYPGSHYDTWSD